MQKGDTTIIITKKRCECIVFEPAEQTLHSCAWLAWSQIHASDSLAHHKPYWYEGSISSFTLLSSCSSVTHTAHDWQGHCKIVIGCPVRASSRPHFLCLQREEWGCSIWLNSSPFIHREIEEVTGRPHWAVCHPSRHWTLSSERMWAWCVAAG